MSDTNDIGVVEPEVGVAPSAPTADRRERVKRAARAVAASILLLLVLFLCVIMWPLPDEMLTDEAGAGDAHARTGSAVRIVGSEASTISDVNVGSRKGEALLVEAVILNDGPERAFDANWLALEISGVRVPPLAVTHEGVGPHTQVPVRLASKRRSSVAVVFVVPPGSTEATLVLQPGNVPPRQAQVSPLVIEGDRP